MKNIIFAILAMVFLAACASNKFDAQIARAEASIEIEKERSYAESIKYANQPKLLWEIKGEVICTEQQKSTNDCGVKSYNASARSVAPERDENWVDGVREFRIGITDTIDKAMPWALAHETRKLVTDISANSGHNTTTTNTDSYNSHSEANQANQKTENTETVSGIKAGNDVDQSQQNQNNPISNATNTDDNSIKDSNNSSTEIKDDKDDKVDETAEVE